MKKPTFLTDFIPIRASAIDMMPLLGLLIALKKLDFVPDEEQVEDL